MSDHVQGSAAWHEARLASVSASRVFDIMPGKRGGYLATRRAYMLELLAERITGLEQELYVTKAMEHGVNTEPMARAAYEAETGRAVTEAGFIKHPTIPNLGASPDGLVGYEGGIEIKCPNTTTHLEVMATGDINPKYIYQMQTGMMCCGRTWWDYVDYDPRVPDYAQFYLIRLKADQAMQADIEAEVRKFNAELDALEAKIRGRV